jgi:hypothetical protein
MKRSRRNLQEPPLAANKLGIDDYNDSKEFWFLCIVSGYCLGTE